MSDQAGRALCSEVEEDMSAAERPVGLISRDQSNNQNGPSRPLDFLTSTSGVLGPAALPRVPHGAAVGPPCGEGTGAGA